MQEIFKNIDDKSTNSLNELFSKILNYFSSFNSEETKSSLTDLHEKHSFYICSILVRRQATSAAASQLHTVYFKQLLDDCLKNHKAKMKRAVKNSNNDEEPLVLSSYHIDFIKVKIEILKLNLHFKDTRQN